jgi:hypothetical protein
MASREVVLRAFKGRQGILFIKSFWQFWADLQFYDSKFTWEKAHEEGLSAHQGSIEVS